MTTTSKLTNQLTALAIAAVSIAQTPSVFAQSESGDDEVVLYDNLPVPFTFGKNTGPKKGDRYLAQQFITGKLGIVSSISIALADANASGVVHLQLWDDLEGNPGSLVASIADVAIPELNSKDDDGNLLTFENPIVDLKPNTPYYLVIDTIDAEVTSTGATFQLAAIDTDEGTEGAAPFHFSDPFTGFDSDPVWTLSPFHLRMRVIESAADLPEDDTEIISIKHSGDKFSLQWRSRPFKTYGIEFSETLDNESWLEIEDGLASNGYMTSFDVNDAEQLAKKEGYYRVRIEN